MKHRLLELFGLLLVLAGVFGLSSALTPPTPVLAGSQHNLSGWAWSSNVGWISFNCTNTQNCATVDYGVNLAGSTFSGFAWSDSVGWISFNAVDLTGCPTAPCTATYDSGTGKLSGWAKAVVTNDASWDGFIALSGTSPDFGVTLAPQTSAFTGYAWGGEVIGWMHWNPTGGGVVLGAVDGGPAVKLVIVDPADTPVTFPATVNIQALRADGTIDTGFDNKIVNLSGTGSVKIPLGTTDTDPTLGPVTIDNGIGVIQITDAVAENSILTIGTTAHTAGLDISSTQTITFYQGPSLTFTVTPQALALPSGTVTAVWSTGNGATSCTASAAPQGNAPSWTGSRAINMPEGEQVAVSGDVQLTLTCLDAQSRSVVQNRQVTTAPATEADVTVDTIPTVTLTVVSSQTRTDSVTGEQFTEAILDWTTANVDTCVGEEGEPQWRAPQAAKSPALLRYTTQSRITKHTTFRITCTGSDPTLQATSVATVFFGPAPSFDLSVTPATLRVSFVSNKPEISTKTVVKLLNASGVPSASLRFSSPQIQNSVKADFATAGTARTPAQVNASSNAPFSIQSSGFTTGADLRLSVPTRLSGGEYKNFKIEARVDLGGGIIVSKELPISLIVQDFRPQFKER